MVSCQLKIPILNLNIPYQQNLNPEVNNFSTPRWVTRDEGDSNYWSPMQHELSKYLSLWDHNMVFHSVNDIHTMVEEFNNYLNMALVNSLKWKSLNNSNKIKQVKWDPYVFKLTCKENLAFKKWKIVLIQRKRLKK